MLFFEYEELGKACLRDKQPRRLMFVRSGQPENNKMRVAQSPVFTEEGTISTARWRRMQREHAGYLL